MYSMHRQFFHNPMYYMDDPAGRGGTFLLTVVTEVMSVGQRTAIPCKMEKTGWAAGLDSVQSREKEKGAARAAHRRLKVRAAAGVGGEAGRSRGRDQAVPTKVVGEASVEEVGGGGRAVSVAGVEEAGTEDRCGGGRRWRPSDVGSRCGGDGGCAGG
jgi:hypothetical protein